MLALGERVLDSVTFGYTKTKYESIEAVIKAYNGYKDNESLYNDVIALNKPIEKLNMIQLRNWIRFRRATGKETLGGNKPGLLKKVHDLKNRPLPIPPRAPTVEEINEFDNLQIMMDQRKQMEAELEASELLDREEIKQRLVSRQAQCRLAI